VFPSCFLSGKNNWLILPQSYLDRNALANARVLGIEDDLGLKGTEFNTCISVFFAGYLTLQIPSNLLLTRVRPSIYLVCVPQCFTAVSILLYLVC
jgi:hypothetical protein